MPMNSISEELFRAHLQHKAKIYQEGLASAGLPAVLIASGGEVYQFLDDITLNYASSAYFRECLPLLFNPDSYLLFDQESGQDATLYLKVVADYWHSAPAQLPSVVTSTVKVVEYSDEADLRTKLKMPNGAAFIGPSASVPSHLTSLTSNPAQLMAYVDYHRAWKTGYELECMREANRLAFVGHKAAEQSFFAGHSEYQIHMSYLNAIQCVDGELPYPNIVALNEHCAVLHHTQLSRNATAPGRSMLIDAGAPCRG